MTQVKTYFCAAGAVGAADAAPALVDLPPSKKAFTQVVLLSNAKWTEKEPNAFKTMKLAGNKIGMQTIQVVPLI